MAAKHLISAGGLSSSKVLWQSDAYTRQVLWVLLRYQENLDSLVYPRRAVSVAVLLSAGAVCLTDLAII